MKARVALIGLLGILTFSTLSLTGCGSDEALWGALRFLQK
ncbi:hypothetical protein CVH13_01114 [Dehalococcoides mccartyi]|uniref:Lipoprotein n=1 Tax=Dehalococcoides mccartyi TaxID=61435 RepID=A0A2J1DWA4_9CHLR|nr:hypothetical protein CVH13_01114 [Dehalococcoides mccartyi]